jgi:allantoin racemase
MNHIHVITPVVDQSLGASLLTAYPAAALTSTKVSFSFLEHGPDAVESMYEDAIAVPETVLRALEAERAGADALIIHCMNDPGLEAIRSVVKIPVVGAAQATMLVTGMLAHKFSIIATGLRDVRPFELLVNRYSLQDKYASIRWIDIPVLDLQTHKEQLIEATVDEVTKAVEKDGAHGIILGCAVMRVVINEVKEILLAKGINIPIIDPALAPLKWVETLLALGLSHSQRTYPLVGKEELLQYPPKFKDEIVTIPGQFNSQHRLTVIVPAMPGERTPDWLELTIKGYCSAARPGNHIEISVIENGPSQLITPYHKAMAVPWLLKLARQAERDGANAVLIDCMDDPGLDAAREALDIPVIGPMQASAFLAASLARNVSIIGTDSITLNLLEDAFVESGMGRILKSVRGIGLTPEEIEKNRDCAKDAMVRESAKAVLEDGAHAILPGCTDMIGMAKSVRDELLLQNIDVPVIEPPAAAVAIAEMICDLGLTQSKRSWPKPPVKSLPGYPELEFV